MVSPVVAAFERAFADVLGHQAVGAASIGIRAGLFAALRDGGPMTASALATRLGFDEHLVRVWCRAAFAFEFLELDRDDRYRLDEGSATVLLDESHPLHMGGRFLFATAAWEDNLTYPEALDNPEVRSRSERDPLVLEAMRATAAPDCAMLIDDVLPTIPGLVAPLEAGGAVLEIGCGSGSLCLALARRFPDARVVGIEFDALSAEQARLAVLDAGLEDRVHVEHADANELAELDTYQLVVMSRSLHETGGPAEHLNVLRRSREALSAEGWAIVSELPYPDDEAEYRDNPDQRRLAGVQLHEAIVGCAMITVSELIALMHDADYHAVHVVEQPRSSRVVAAGRKPPSRR